MNDRAAADDDFEIITPPANLRSKVRQMGPREAANFDPVGAAEAALKKLSTNFNSWMDQETETLRVIWVEIRHKGLDEARRDELFRHAHDIKGQAATLGFPVAGHVADSLCHLLEAVTDVSKVPVRLIEQHVQAIRAIVAEDARDERDQVANALAEQLTDVTRDYVASVTTADD